MPKINRRKLLQTGAALAIPSGLAMLLTGCNQSEAEASTPQQEEAGSQSNETEAEPDETTEESNPMKIQYLEIVTAEVDALCNQYSTIYNITFSEPNPGFGGARTAEFDGGGMMGIRGPMREGEAPVVRPYVLVEDIQGAVDAAVEAGAQVAMQPMEIPGQGKFAIVIHGGIDCGFWQN